ncbi:MAG: sulfotransferase family protein [Acidimicrobiales bacterium]
MNHPALADQAPSVTPYGARHVPPAGVPARARAVARRLIRRYGMLTAGARIGPDYLIIGTKRGGTTSLARWLLDHPQVQSLFPARETRKGTYYFDVNYARGEAWYRSHFPTRVAHARAEVRAGRPLQVGEATPYYLHHPHAPVRARRLAPDARIIALLRNPVDRAHGHWAERHRQGVETLDFDAALAAEPGRLAGEEARMLVDPSYVSFAHQHFSYVDQGRYARGLERWMTAYPEEQLMVVRSEDLYADPMAVYREVLVFLGLDDHRPDALVAWNNRSRDDLPPETRAHLTDLLAPDVAATEALLGRSMEWL